MVVRSGIWELGATFLNIQFLLEWKEQPFAGKLYINLYNLPSVFCELQSSVCALMCTVFWQHLTCLTLYHTLALYWTMCCLHPCFFPFQHKHHRVNSWCLQEFINGLCVPCLQNACFHVQVFCIGYCSMSGTFGFINSHHLPVSSIYWGSSVQ